MENKIATLIRIDEKLYEEIKYYSVKENRSINKQIEYILKRYVEDQERKEESILSELSV